jgi:hypothetical protein
LRDRGRKVSARTVSPFKFAPDEGPAFFERCGMIALLPDSKGRQPRSPRGGVCLFEKVRESPVSGSSTQLL